MNAIIWAMNMLTIGLVLALYYGLLFEEKMSVKNKILTAVIFSPPLISIILTAVK